MSLATITPYTTAALIQSRISVEAGAARTDDDPDTMAQVIKEATIEVQGYCLVRYSDAQLQASNWIQLRTTDLAVMMLCERRLNPAPQSAVRKYEKAIKDLERIETGLKNIPDAATRKAAAPTLSNQLVKLWPHPNVVNIPHSSTGDPDGYRRPTDPLDYDPDPNG